MGKTEPLQGIKVAWMAQVVVGLMTMCMGCRCSCILSSPRLLVAFLL